MSDNETINNLSENQLLKQSITKLKHQSLLVKNTDGLLTILDEFYKSTPVTKFNNKLLFKIIAGEVLFAVMAIIGFFLYSQYSAVINDEIFIVLPIVSLVIIAVTIIVAISSRGTSPNSLGKTLFFKSVLFDYDLLAHNSSLHPVYSKYSRLFFELNRGNHSNRLRFFYEGQWEKNDIEFDYRYLHYHYINRETRTYYDGKRMRTKTVLVDYYRHGIIVDFPFIKNIAISSFRAPRVSYKKYSTAYDKFNKKFKCSFQTEMEISKFLKPALVLKIADNNILKKANIEINHNGQMMLSFSNSIFNLPKSPDLSDQTEFVAAIKEDIQIHDFNKTLDFIAYLMKYSDNNFQKGT